MAWPGICWRSLTFLWMSTRRRRLWVQRASSISRGRYEVGRLCGVSLGCLVLRPLGVVVFFLSGVLKQIQEDVKKI